MKFKFITTRFQSIYPITNESGEILHTTDTLAYGEELTAPYEDSNDKVLNTITYTGHEKDYETDLTYMLARYYSQGYGRFLSPDPGYDYDQLDPMSWNLYAYVRGNPVVRLDKTGKETYLLLYGSGALATDMRGETGDVGRLFEYAAITRKKEIEESSGFNPQKDKVIIKKVTNHKEFNKVVTKKYKSGKIKELDVFSHGTNNPYPALNLGGDIAGKYDLKEVNSNTLKNVRIDFSKDSIAIFWGCNTGSESSSGESSFAQHFANQYNITTYGFTNSVDFDITTTNNGLNVHMKIEEGKKGRMKKFIPEKKEKKNE